MIDITHCIVCKNKLSYKYDYFTCENTLSIILINNIQCLHSFSKTNNKIYLSLTKRRDVTVQYYMEYTDKWYISRYPTVAVGDINSSVEELTQNYDIITKTLELFS